MRHRHKYEVIAAILTSCDRKETFTRIMYKSMLSNEHCKFYIQLLINCGLINAFLEREKKCYARTEKGNRFLLNFEKLMEILPTVISKQGKINQWNKIQIIF